MKAQKFVLLTVLQNDGMHFLAPTSFTTKN